MVDKVAKLDEREERMQKTEQEHSGEVGVSPGSPASGGPRPARIGGTGKRRDLRRSLVWEGEGLHFKKEEKEQAQGIWGLSVKKNRTNADFLVTSIMMNPELREIDLAMII